MVEQQAVYYENAKRSDKILERKIQRRHDTRAAAMIENLSKTGKKLVLNNGRSGGGGLDAFLFGPRPQVSDFLHVLYAYYMFICCLESVYVLCNTYYAH